MLSKHCDIWWSSWFYCKFAPQNLYLAHTPASNITPIKESNNIWVGEPILGKRILCLWFYRVVFRKKLKHKNLRDMNIFNCRNYKNSNIPERCLTAHPVCFVPYINSLSNKCWWFCCTSFSSSRQGIKLELDILLVNIFNYHSFLKKQLDCSQGKLAFSLVSSISKFQNLNPWKHFVLYFLNVYYPALPYHTLYVYTIHYLI